ncbi:hypothetical protein Droror1_Dr00017123 [Drosera rotundifolia]
MSSKKEKSPKTQSKTMKHFPQNPSFSSTLLDEIYRSIDDDPSHGQDTCYHRETDAEKRSEEEERATSLRRARLIEKWMEKKGNEKVQHVSSHKKPPRQSQYSFEDLEKKFYHHDQQHHDHLQQHDVVIPFSNSSSSSDSSSGGFSSSETDSFYVSKTKSSCITAPWPRPVRTNPASRATKSTNPYLTRKNPFEDYANHKNVGDRKLDDSFVKSKSKASKFYSNLKNMKQPVSPGMRLSSLIGSLFVKENTKNKKTMTKSSDSRNEGRKQKSEPPSTCSSASSFTRSCIMSRTSSPCSEPRMQTGMRKSVRFVSAIADQDDVRFRQKGMIKGDDQGLNSAKIDGKKLERALSKRYQEIKRINGIEKSRELEDIALGLLNGYRNGKEKDGHARNASDSIKTQIQDYDHDHDNDLLDCSSCSSSDLFELDHLKLAARDELPVYETTKLSKDQSCQR